MALAVRSLPSVSTEDQLNLPVARGKAFVMSKMLTKNDVFGIIPPLVTPFTKDGAIDQASFISELHYAAEFEIHGVAVGGSTGEGQSLSPEECAGLVRIARAELSDELPVIAGIITTNTRDAVRRAILAGSAGASAVMVTPPIYGSCSQDGLFGFYSEICEGGGLPVVLYNVVSGSPLTPQVTTHLAEIPGVIATKESSAGSLETLDLLLRDLSDRLAVTWAQDELMVPGYALGAVGSISAINAVLPYHSVRAFDAVRAGDLQSAVRLHRQLTAVARLFVGPNKPALVKAAINLQGRSAGFARRPFIPPSPEVERQLSECLQAIELPLASTKRR
jgi:4-hydroxy-tetrahydrodipicolinate synthase